MTTHNSPEEASAPAPPLRENTAPHDIREVLSEWALQLMAERPEIKTLRDALDIVRQHLGMRREAS